MIAPCVAPWYERYCTMILLRPVCNRAIRMAFSFASAPPLVKNAMSRSPGASSARRRASSPRLSLARLGAMVHRRSAWSLIAWTIFGCWWPIDALTSWEAKSR
jgi:hypothetical protein